MSSFKCCRALKPEEQNYSGKRLDILQAVTAQTYVGSFMAFLDIVKPEASHEEKVEHIRKYITEWFDNQDLIEHAIKTYAITQPTEYVSDLTRN